MLIRVLSQTPLSSNNKNSFFNRKFIVLFALGGASVTAFWIYRRNIYKFMQNRRKEDKMNRRLIFVWGFLGPTFSDLVVNLGLSALLNL
ncbi:unnamed protein product [Meloidogyne enterolobii]|uniref:Uncharacterized protein n=1 Tax=Meloidogyne enterolobii TaxID=390850 RepID=A0ACB0ZE83_MELEN